MAYKKRLKKEDLVRIINTEISYSQTYNTKIARERAKAFKYFNKEPFGNEKKGRAAYVSSEVQETISWIMPQIMKVFHSEDVVQFDPTGPGTEIDAELATAYCTYVLYKKNPGFLIIHDFVFDALLQKNGILKIYYDNTIEYSREEFKGLNDLELTQLLQDEDVEPVEHDSQESEPNPLTGETQQTHDITIKRKKAHQGKIKIINVPPEEIVVSSRTRSLDLDDSPFVAHRVQKTISWLREQGYKIEDDIEDGTDASTAFSQERIARDTRDGTFYYDNHTQLMPTDPSQREVWVVEAYFKCDYNGDGIAEYRKVTKVGNKILDNEEVYTQPFVSTSPFPQPHKWNGRSMADEVMDLQLLKSMLMRANLDSMTFNINPAKAIDMNKVVDPNDLLDTNPGNYIKMRGDINNAFFPLPSTGVGAESFKLLEYIDNIAESRSGVSRMTQGIDGNVFNKTATGTQAIMSASQEKIALIIRIIAETGIGPMYKKIIGLATNYADGPELIRINSEFAEVDPKQWTNLDTITICVGTGALDKQQDLVNINQLLALQEKIGGLPPQISSMVDPNKVYNSVSRLIKGMGYKNPAEFFNNPKGQLYQQGLQAASQQTPPPDPNMIMAQSQMALAQVKGQQVQADTQKTQQEMFLKQQDLDLRKAVEVEKATYNKQKLQLENEIEVAKINQSAFNDLIGNIEGQLGAVGEGVFQAPENLQGQLGILKKVLGPQEEVKQQLVGLTEQMNKLSDHLTKPKVVVRDDNGRIVGTKTLD